jgi:DNA-binding IclR family transcriptional regulator
VSQRYCSRGDITPRRIAEILEILGDGEWHSIGEVQKEMRLNENQVKRITEFLSEYEFIAVDNSKSKMRIKEAVRSFLLQPATS